SMTDRHTVLQEVDARHGLGGRYPPKVALSYQQEDTASAALLTPRDADTVQCEAASPSGATAIPLSRTTVPSLCTSHVPGAGRDGAYSAGNCRCIAVRVIARHRGQVASTTCIASPQAYAICAGLQESHSCRELTNNT